MMLALLLFTTVLLFPFASCQTNQFSLPTPRKFGDAAIAFQIGTSYDIAWETTATSYYVSVASEDRGLYSQTFGINNPDGSQVTSPHSFLIGTNLNASLGGFFFFLSLPGGDETILFESDNFYPISSATASPAQLSSAGVKVATVLIDGGSSAAAASSTTTLSTTSSTATSTTSSTATSTISSTATSTISSSTTSTTSSSVTSTASSTTTPTATPQPTTSNLANTAAFPPTSSATSPPASTTVPITPTSGTNTLAIGLGAGLGVLALGFLAAFAYFLVKYRRVGHPWGKERSELGGAGSGGSHSDAGRYAGTSAEEEHRELEAEQYHGAELENRPRGVEVEGRPLVELEAEATPAC